MDFTVPSLCVWNIAKPSLYADDSLSSEYGKFRQSKWKRTENRSSRWVSWTSWILIRLVSTFPVLICVVVVEWVWNTYRIWNKATVEHTRTNKRAYCWKVGRWFRIIEAFGVQLIYFQSTWIDYMLYTKCWRNLWRTDNFEVECDHCIFKGS